MRCWWVCLAYGSIRLILLYVEVWSSYNEKAASWTTVALSVLAPLERRIGCKAKDEGCPSCKIFCSLWGPYQLPGNSIY